MSGFITVFLSVFALFNIYTGYRIIARWPWAAQHAAVCWAIIAAFFVLQLVGVFGDRLFFPRLRKDYDGLVLALDWASYIAFGLMSVLIFYNLAADIIGVVWQLVDKSADPLAIDRRALLTLGAATLGTTALGVGQVIAGPVVREVEIPLRNLPTRFDGFKIAQVSDLHVGPTIRLAYTQTVTDIVNRLTPDLIALTGDFSDGSVEDLAEHLAPIGEMRAPHGMYFVTGNHEYFSDPLGWMAYFRNLGARVLNNEHTVISREKDAIVLAGVTDYSTRGMGNDHASSPAKALAGAPEGVTRIMLAHQPASHAESAQAGVDLQLSGHTHSGQYFPFTLLIGFFQPYHKGLYWLGKMALYVNCGTGYWGPPLRAAMAPEITLITLRSAKS